MRPNRRETKGGVCDRLRNSSRQSGISGASGQPAKPATFISPARKRWVKPRNAVKPRRGEATHPIKT